MTTEGRTYFSGDTLEQAIMQAARHHGIEPEEVAYKKVEKRHGFLRARRGIVIEVDPEAPRRTAAETAPDKSMPGPEEATPTEPEAETDAEPGAEPEAEPEAEPAAEPETGPEAGPGAELEAEATSAQTEAASDLTPAARRGVQEMLEFAKLDLESEVSEGAGQLEIELTGPDQERLLEDRGSLLLAIQHLLPRLIRGYTGRSIPCRVDSENFHQTRQAELEELAQGAAQEVLRRGQPRTLQPMNPAERRIIHLSLADDVDVVTESQGRGFYKRVTIRPARRRPRGFDRYSR